VFESENQSEGIGLRTIADSRRQSRFKIETASSSSSQAPLTKLFIAPAVSSPSAPGNDPNRRMRQSPRVLPACYQQLPGEHNRAKNSGDVMKLWMWVFVGFSVTGISGGLIVVTHANPIFVAIFAAANVVATLGTLWMMYVAMRAENPPWPMFWLAFLPFSSLWYYFERVRPRRLHNVAPPPNK
jgi:hypothetical protein